ALRKSRVGAIFIELAIAMPVLIAVVYYLHDIPKYRRMHEKMKFAAHCAVSMMQQHGKRITRLDLSYIRYASGLVICPGKSMYLALFGYESLWYLYYVVGTGHNKSLTRWCWDSGTGGIGGIGQFNNGSDHSVVNGFERDSKKVYNSLEIEVGEAKIILDMCCHINTFNASQLRKNFGLYVISIPTTSYTCFHSVAIFTPNPGLFSDDAPT
ncbi:MAG: hypothetical protein LBB21_02120, partial [Holosporaceae bacterium]|nr:hypothetical protein [Holosporaceae bacterium]